MVVHDGPDASVSARVASSRAVMSVRSIARPSVRNCHASSRLVDESVMPTASAERSRTHWKNSCTFSLCRRRGIRELVVLASPTAPSRRSRARGGRSRARLHGVGDARRVGAVDGEAGEHVAAGDLDRRAGGTEPMTPMSERQAVSSSIHGSSSSSCRCTSRMRAVPSLRSM
jgi:hypothetical protein